MPKNLRKAFLTHPTHDTKLRISRHAAVLLYKRREIKKARKRVKYGYTKQTDRAVGRVSLIRELTLDGSRFL